MLRANSNVRDNDFFHLQKNETDRRIEPIIHNFVEKQE